MNKIKSGILVGIDELTTLTAVSNVPITVVNNNLLALIVIADLI